MEDYLFLLSLLKDYLEKIKQNTNQIVKIKVHTLDSTYVSFISNDSAFTHTSNEKDLINHIKTNISNEDGALLITELDKNLTFQDYITLKSLLSKIEIENLTIAIVET